MTLNLVFQIHVCIPASPNTFDHDFHKLHWGRAGGGTGGGGNIHKKQRKIVMLLRLNGKSHTTVSSKGHA